MTAEEVIRHLGLKPHPAEGGYFVETYRSAATIPATALAASYDGDRSQSTAIYYLLTPETFSALHRLRSDEIFHFYLGDPVEMLQLLPDGSGKVCVLGPDLTSGMLPQVVVPAGVWQGSRLRPGGQWALLGTTVSPGFDFADYETGTVALRERYPDFAAHITQLTR